MSSERHLCIHAHFYQPPRENPWLETVELQDSAYPYHDWNERITAECYARNATARVLDREGRITRLVNNYEWMSFDFGPTLLSWMETNAPETYAAVLEADRESRSHFGGHGSAIAQVYNHLIMPLANRRDKETQVRWGLRDFERRFGRSSEGIWLAETAVDLETLEVLAEHGVSYTVLAPSQAARVRPLGSGGEWQDVSGSRIDPTRSYLQRLPSGRMIALFFYDGPISQAIAFEGLLERGEELVDRLLLGFDSGRDWPQLVHVATDGETYGHHHRRGEMALAYALQTIQQQGLVRLTNYGEHLERQPPTIEVEILERTAWSCSHGIGRWCSDCGCSSGGHPGWNQGWRAPLREALDWLRDEVAPRYQEVASTLLADPWAARDGYIEVTLDRSPETRSAFFARHGRRELSEEEQVTALELLELQRHALLMYTSCGWFFDEISGIEAVQVLQYAGRVVQLARETLGLALEAPFLERLERARSNLAEHGDGRRIYEKWVRPAALDLSKVAAHYAISSLLGRHPDHARIYCYAVETEDYRRLEPGTAQVVLGRARITSEVTRRSLCQVFGVLHFGEHNVNAGVAGFDDPAAYERLCEETRSAAERGDVAEIVRAFDRHFGSFAYTVQTLFRDVQRRFLDRVLESTLHEDQAILRQLYDRRAPLMRLLGELSAPLPRALHAAAELVINHDLGEALAKDEPDREAVHSALEQGRRFAIKLDQEGLSYQLERTLGRLAAAWRAAPAELGPLSRLLQVVELALELPFEVRIWAVQNAVHEIRRTGFLDLLERRDDGELEAAEWIERFLALGERTGVRVMSESEGNAPTVASILQELLEEPRVPRATYRLQLNPGFTFADAAALVPYLRELGVSDCYSSPVFRARSGSQHGYDVCDHAAIEPALGGEPGLQDLSTALREHGMGLLLDIVPNHMGVGDEANAWWMDVLENGPSSLYAPCFDIEWRPVKPELANKVLLPMLEDQYGRVLESGKVRLAYEEGAFFLYYYATKLPVAPGTYSLVLGHRRDRLLAELGEGNELLQEYESILTAIGYLPARDEQDRERQLERNREKEVIKRRIASLYASSPEVRTAIDETVEAFNGRPGDPSSFDLLDSLVDAQAFRPAFWRVAAEEINYRRFFDVNELAAIRTEDPAVFDATHALTLRLLASGVVQGLRIDHIDGLYDPTGYLRTLQQSYLGEAVRVRLASAGRIAPDAEVLSRRIGERLEVWLAEREAAGHSAPPLYVVAEKILSPTEPLPRRWLVHGTTGYDFLNACNGLFVDGRRREAVDAIYRRFTGSATPYRELLNRSKKMTMLVSMASEIHALSHKLERCAERNRHYRDFTLATITFALREVIACLPVYRTYISAPERVSVEDRQVIEAAVAEAKRRNPRTATSLFDFIGDTLLLANLADFKPELQPRLLEWVRRVQQVTGPVMAKGAEDTAFYVYNRLVSLNEVGGHPDLFGVSVADFHARNLEVARTWPSTLLASSTHDSKRGEDVRARIDVISELPEEYGRVLRRWSELSAGARVEHDAERLPDANDELLLYQTLIGSFPDELLEPGGDRGVLESYRGRIAAYMEKATREAKVHTSWVNPSGLYDQAVRGFVEAVLAEGGSAFDPEVLALIRRVAFFGRLGSLASLVLKLTCPGVPDLFQGSELWDLSLVDPDNRRPVDFERRRDRLARLRRRIEEAGVDLRPLATELLGRAADGDLKLFTLHRALIFRREAESLFREGSYLPLEVSGPGAEHLCAFARDRGDERVVVAVPRLLASLLGGEPRLPLGAGVWGETRVQLDRKGRYRNLYTGEAIAAGEPGASLPVSDLLASFPVAILRRER